MAMASMKGNSLLLSVLIFSIVVVVSSRGAVYRPPKVEPLTDRFSHVTVNQSFSQIWGGQNIHVKNNGSNVDIGLDKTTGCGLVSKNKYYYGFFSAAMKLPPGFTSGVVVAFYLSNADVYPRNHDEIDIELLGHERRKEWVLQTNIYGNGSVHTGREEKFYLWFDPTLDFHQYSILWNNHHTVFLVDNVPVREVLHNAEIGSVYPSKPMSLYTTIWDGSEWATRGGKYPVDYKYAPFVTSMGELELEGCVTGDKDSVPPCSKSSVSSLDPVEGEQYAKLSKQQSDAMAWSRGKHMFYSYCKDTKRYKVLPAECNAK